MYTFIKFLHLAAAIVWLGGMSFVLGALRPALTEQLPPPQRLPLLARVLQRFFKGVAAAVLVLLLGGGYMLAQASGAQAAPLGWHLMSGIGLLMSLIFGHIYFVPYRRLQAAVAAADWPAAGRQAGQITTLVIANFWLGWLAIAAITFLT